MKDEDYVPSHERPGFSEKLVEKLPSGWCGQRTDHWGNKVKRTNATSEKQKPRKSAAARGNFNRMVES
jgi:hypothetical protein